jgi:very-short-patch-repair endonuclease
MGSVHLTQKEYDNERQKIIEDLGIKVLRFKNKDVQYKIKKVLLTIKNNFNPSPSKMEKGVKD